MKKYSFPIILILCCTLGFKASAQNTTDEETNNEETTFSDKGFKIGLFVGALFPNQYTASTYDGYGFDIDGNKYNFENSFMYQKIILQYGGGYGNGQIDQIANALKVNHDQWHFNESDMPVNMRYNVSMLFGLQMRYSVDSKNAILLNVNMSQLKISGNFTISTDPPSGSTQINNSIQTFAIMGQEQRLLFQLGYQRILGDNEKLNLLAEGGLNVTIAKFDKNQIAINNLIIDLTSSYDYPGYTSTRTKRPIGTGYGAFAGIGVHITMSQKFIIQLMYNPSYEKIKIGVNPRLKFQHAVGLRAYYNF